MKQLFPSTVYVNNLTVSLPQNLTEAGQDCRKQELALANLDVRHVLVAATRPYKSAVRPLGSTQNTIFATLQCADFAIR